MVSCNKFECKITQWLQIIFTAEINVISHQRFVDLLRFRRLKWLPLHSRERLFIFQESICFLFFHNNNNFVTHGTNCLAVWLWSAWIGAFLCLYCWSQNAVGKFYSMRTSHFHTNWKLERVWWWFCVFFTILLDWFWTKLEHD